MVFLFDGSTPLRNINFSSQKRLKAELSGSNLEYKTVLKIDISEQPHKYLFEAT